MRTKKSILHVDSDSSSDEEEYKAPPKPKPKPQPRGTKIISKEEHELHKEHFEFLQHLVKTRKKDAMVNAIHDMLDSLEKIEVAVNNKKPLNHRQLENMILDEHPEENDDYEPEDYADTRHLYRSLGAFESDDELEPEDAEILDEDYSWTPTKPKLKPVPRGAKRVPARPPPKPASPKKATPKPKPVPRGAKPVPRGAKPARPRPPPPPPGSPPRPAGSPRYRPRGHPCGGSRPRCAGWPARR